MFELNAERFCVTSTGCSGAGRSTRVARYCSTSPAQPGVQKHDAGMAAISDGCAEPKLFAYLTLSIEKIVPPERGDLSHP
ncbi:hypothetical protein MEX01_41810 [Methylorubrum extorquens]|nr:hypothetical protein MEX01_41810 [Methylorubrum extorquens]